MFLGALSAQADVAISDNIYGVINIPISVGLNSIGINVLPLPGDTNLVQSLMIPNASMDVGTDLTTGDNLYTYSTGVGYSKYWLADQNGTNVWINGEGVKPAATPGMGMWIKASGPTTLYQVGLVSTNATRTVDCPVGNTFVASPYAGIIDFDGANSDVNWTGVAASEKYDIFTADLIKIWDGVGYKTYYYFNNATYPAYTGWYDAEGNRPSEIDAGKGFWFVRRTENLNTTAITFGKPF